MNHMFRQLPDDAPVGYAANPTSDPMMTSTDENNVACQHLQTINFANEYLPAGNLLPCNGSPPLMAGGNMPLCPQASEASNYPHKNTPSTPFAPRYGGNNYIESQFFCGCVGGLVGESFHDQVYVYNQARTISQPLTFRGNHVETNSVAPIIMKVTNKEPTLESGGTRSNRNKSVKSARKVVRRPNDFWELDGYRKVKNDKGRLDCFGDCEKKRHGERGFSERHNIICHLRACHEQSIPRRAPIDRPLGA